MRPRKGRMDWFGAMGLCLVFGLAGCVGSSAAVNGQSGTGGQAMAGTSGQASGGAGSGGAGMASGTGGGTVGGADAGTNADGNPSNSGTGGASTGADASGTLGSGGTGGAAAFDAAATGGRDGGLDATATNDAPTSGSGCAGLLFCDDFESYTAASAPSGKWTTQARGSAKAVVDTAMAFSGSKSVHFTGTVNQSLANIVAQGAPVFPIQGNTVFIRMMMYTKTYPATSGTHTRLMRIGMSTNGQNGSAYALDTYNGTGIEHINSGMFRDTGLHLGDTLVTGKWVCWEWALDNTAGPPAGDTGTVMAYLWRDGTALPLAVTRDSLPWNPIPWQLLEVGLEAYQADTVPGDFWIDDVAINNKRIGCPTK